MSRQLPQGPYRSLVVLGESNVQGGPWLARQEERWADILHGLIETAQEQPLAYHNAGLSASVISPNSPGYAASAKPSASERLDDEVIAHNPDLVAVAYGLNDMRAGMPLEDFRQQVEGIIERVYAALPARIVIVNVYHMTGYEYYPPFDKGGLVSAKRYNWALAEIAARLDCVYADVWQAAGQKNHVIHFDTVHSNKIGNMLIAHKVFEAVVHASPGIAANVKARDRDTEWTKECLELQANPVEQNYNDA